MLKNVILYEVKVKRHFKGLLVSRSPRCAHSSVSRIEPRYDTIHENRNSWWEQRRQSKGFRGSKQFANSIALFTPYSTNVIVLAFISVSYTALKKEMLVKPDHESAVAHLF